MGVALRSELLKMMDLPSDVAIYGDYSPWFPNPITCFMEMTYTMVYVFIRNMIPWDGVGQWLRLTWEWHYISTFITLNDLVYVILMAIFFTLLRYIMYKMLLEHIPVWFGLLQDEREKFPEAAFRTIIYLLLWIFSCWSMQRRNYFFKPMTIWENWAPGYSIPTDIYICYIIQMGFYVHMIYATTYIETVRKDYLVQMIHHFLTLALLAYSLTLRFHTIGLFVLFIHDIADVFLEFAKCVVYFKTMNNAPCKSAEILANIVFVLFVVQWILFRLYWYPVKLLYTTGHLGYVYINQAPFYCLFNIMLVTLYLLHVYWFYFILLVLVKVYKGDEIVDNRDIEEKKKD